MSMLRGLYDKRSAAEYLSCSVRKVAELRLGGKLPAVKSGNQWMFTREALDFYISKLPSE